MTFGSLSIAYDDRVLAPRAWTRSQSAWARELLDVVPPGPVLELCSGVGHIGLLAVAGTERRLVCVDVDPVACAYAERNAAAAGRGHLVEVRNHALDAFVSDEVFALVIADPPWVRSEHVGCFPADPVLAIDGGADGLDRARECVRLIDRHLHADGAALLQLGSYAEAEELSAELPATLRIAVSEAEPGRGLVVELVRPR
ncbi:methyltransferase [Nocardioides nitrophenolicus]|uniref:methyltransferase n=1 Tax=Nocardioides nitrophenolicus TaxID=60489 RepID=UPI0019601271|nr:methyltransferase [Nocardioides nitrophenolicus]MBM7520488.1 release factor glutamine methyltransferase/ribosomal protein L3 glutamine methyltransferase [Nocardioides nitrophenolicus]